MNLPMLQQAASGPNVQADHNETASEQTISRPFNGITRETITTVAAVLAAIGALAAAIFGIVTWVDTLDDTRHEAVTGQIDDLSERITRVDARAEQRDAQLREDIKALDAKLDEVLALIRQG